MASKNKKLSIAADILGDNIDGSIRKISINEISPTVDQPRQEADINIQQLSQSLQTEGLLQPIVVKKEGNSFKIIAGERRYRAAKLAGWEEIECRILHKSAQDSYRLAVIENIQRENLNPVEESEAYKRLKTEYQYTDQQLSEILGKSRNYITEILSIADIPVSIRSKAIDAGMSTRNLLIQLAVAVKNNIEQDFITSYQNGNINSVKTAKSFNKNKKNIHSLQTNKLNPKASKLSPEFKVKTTGNWQSEDHIELKLDIQHIKNVNFPLSVLENELEKSLYQILKKLL